MKLEKSLNTTLIIIILLIGEWMKKYLKVMMNLICLVKERNLPTICLDLNLTLMQLLLEKMIQ